MSKEPETTFELVQKWMKKAAENCRAQGKRESALLWSDALQHLEHQQGRIASLEQQVAELSKDKARLDWLDSKQEFEGRYQRNSDDLERVYFYLSDPWDEVFSGEGSDLRGAIDAAMKQEQEHE